MRPNATPCAKHRMMCVNCGKQAGDPANALGRGCAWVVMFLVGIIAVTPLLWAARVAMAWAMGI